MSDAFEDLLGGPPAPAPNKGGRPTREEAAAKLQAQLNLTAAAAGQALKDIGGVQALRRPVTINTLATVFGHDIQTITRRLIDCPFVMVSNRKLYDFREACAYIVKPKMTPEQFIKTLNSQHLPPEINKAFWDGQRSRVKYKIEAQEAWETEDVLHVFGEVFMTIKDVLQMVPEELRERAKLTDEQATLVEGYIDNLRQTMREKLVEMPTKARTSSMFEKPLFGAPGAAAPDTQDDWDDGSGDE
jgi:hypothetical protein